MTKIKNEPISEERIKQLLPKNILETDEKVLSSVAKKLLAAIINRTLLERKARENGCLAANNSSLIGNCKCSPNKFQEALTELIETNLIIRIPGEARKKGITTKASTYYVNIENLKKEVRKKNNDDILAELGELQKASRNKEEFLETPLNTPITNAISIPISNSNPISISNSISVSDSISTPVTSTEKTKKVNESSMVLDYKKEEKEIENLEEKRKEWKYQLGSMIRATVLEITGEGN